MRILCLQHFSLLQNFPNPFNPTTTVSFSIQKSEIVNISVFDLSGKEVYKLVDNKYFPPGVHSVKLNGSDLASGMYFYQMRTGVDQKLKRCYC